MSCRRLVTGPRRHRCSRAHRELVEGYRAARQAWEDQAEVVALGYGTELAELRASSPPPVFRDWLMHREPAA